MQTPREEGHTGTSITDGLATVDATNKMPSTGFDRDDEFGGSTDSEVEDQSAAYAHQNVIQRQRVQNAKFKALFVFGSFH